MNFNEVPYRYPARSVVIDGYRIAYVDVNPDAGNPIVVMHEAAGDLDDFAVVYEAIANRRAVGLDFVGFGKSDKPPLDDPVALYTHLLGGFLDAVEIERASFVGHGLGALVAARFAADHPDRVEKLVLSALHGMRPLDADARATAAHFWSYDNIVSLDDDGRRAWYEAMVAGWNGHLEANLVVRNQLATSLAYRPWAHAVEDAASAALTYPTPEVLSRIGARTLVVWGVDDPVTPFADAAAACDAIRNSRLVAIEDCGHMPTFEQPGAFVEAVITFLSQGGTALLVAQPSVRTSVDVEPWPGLTPGVGRLARMIFEQRERFAAETEGLSLDELAWSSPPECPSIGDVLLRSGSRAVRALYDVLEGVPIPDDVSTRFYLGETGEIVPGSAPRRTAARHLSDVEWAHEELAAWLARCSDADLNRTFVPYTGGVGMTLRWVLWRLVTETSADRGEVACLRSVVRAQPTSRRVYPTPSDIRS